jgi:tetratricopeptide (TPR) repeat protein
LVLSQLNQLEPAESAFIKAVTLSEEAEDPFLTALTRGNLGDFYYNQGRLESARSAFHRALELSDRFVHPLFSCMIRQRWINLLHYMGRAQDAETTCYDLLRRSIQSQFPQQQATALNYLALLAGQENHREQQLRYLNQAIGLLHPQKPTHLLAQLLINRSYANHDLKRFVPAQLDGEAALNSAEKQSDGSLASLARLILGKIFRDRPKPDLNAASRYLEKARQGIVESQNPHLLWEVFFEEGLLAKKQGQKSRAFEYFLLSEKHLKSVLEGVPEEHRESYLRDRKLEKIASEMSELKNSD